MISLLTLHARYITYNTHLKIISLQGIFVFAIYNYKEVECNDTKYPSWATSIGWFLALLSMLCIPFRALWVLWDAEGDGFYEVFILYAFIPCTVPITLQSVSCTGLEIWPSSMCLKSNIPKYMPPLD